MNNNGMRTVLMQKKSGALTLLLAVSVSVRCLLVWGPSPLNAILKQSQIGPETRLTSYKARAKLSDCRFFPGCITQCCRIVLLSSVLAPPSHLQP